MLYGGDDDDWLDGGNGTNVLIGGRGNDRLLSTGPGDIVAFRRGDGRDTLAANAIGTASASAERMIVLGAVRAADLSLLKDGEHLVLDVGQGDAMVLENWYRNPGQAPATLVQITSTGEEVLQGSPNEVNFNLNTIAQQFDQQRYSDSTLRTWAMGDALISHMASMDAYEGQNMVAARRYAKRGGFSGSGADFSSPSLASAHAQQLAASSWITGLAA